jgi:protein SCO1/2
MSKNVRTALIMASVAVIIGIGFTLKIISLKQGEELQEIRMFPKNLDLPDFSLQDEARRPFSKDSLIGKWNILFFGYSNCPDVCPTTMANLAKIVKRLPESQQQKLQVIFVSVDPERDTPEHLKTYVEYFNKNFRGVTGSHDQLQPFAKSLGAIYFKGAEDEKGNYPVDHSSKLFLVNPQGKRAGIFDGQIVPPAKTYPFDALTTDLKIILK